MEQLPNQPPEALTNCPQCGYELDLAPPEHHQRVRRAVAESGIIDEILRDVEAKAKNNSPSLKVEQQVVESALEAEQARLYDTGVRVRRLSKVLAQRRAVEAMKAVQKA
jgi:predicted  nucleic acid-binding Zn-ribbon protein